MAKGSPKSNETLTDLENKAAQLFQELEESQEFDGAKVRNALSFITDVYKKISEIQGKGGAKKEIKKIASQIRKLINDGLLNAWFLSATLADLLEQIKEIIVKAMAKENEEKRIQFLNEIEWQKFIAANLALIDKQQKEDLANFKKELDKWLEKFGKEYHDALQQWLLNQQRREEIRFERVIAINDTVIEFSGHYDRHDFHIPKEEFEDVIRRCVSGEAGPIESEKDFIEIAANEIADAEPLTQIETEGLNPIEVDRQREILKAERLNAIKARLTEIAQEIKKVKGTSSLEKVCALSKEEHELDARDKELEKRIKELEGERKKLGEDFKKTLQEIQKTRPDKKQEGDAVPEGKRQRPGAKLTFC